MPLPLLATLGVAAGTSLLDSFLSGKSQDAANRQQQASIEQQQGFSLEQQRLQQDFQREQAATLANNAGISLEEANRALSGANQQFRNDITSGATEQLRAIEGGRQQSSDILSGGQAAATDFLTQGGAEQLAAANAGFGQATNNINQGFAQGRQDLTGAQATQQGQLDQFNQFLGNFGDTAQTAQQAQLALLGLGGEGAGQQVSQNLLNSPLVQAINAQNQNAVNSRAAASGVSGGNVLAALQEANTSTILQAGLGGLQNLSGQGLQGALGFGNLSGQSVGDLTNIGGNLANLATQGGLAQAGLSERQGLTGADIAGGVSAGSADLATLFAQLQAAGAQQAGAQQAGILGGAAQQIGEAGLTTGLTNASAILNQGNLGGLAIQNTGGRNINRFQPGQLRL